MKQDGFLPTIAFCGHGFTLINTDIQKVGSSLKLIFEQHRITSFE